MLKNLRFDQISGYVPLVCAVLTASLMLLLTLQFGAGLTPDSAAYIAAARNIAAGRGPLLFNGAPMVAWPPLYPAVLAVSQITAGIDPVAIAPIINAVLFGAIVYLSGRLFFRYLKSPVLAILGTVLVAVSVTFFSVVVMAWSEPLFVFLTLGYFASFDAFRANRRIGWLVVAAICVAFAAVTRYVGLYLIPVGAISVFLFVPGSLKARIGTSILFAAIASIPTIVWGWRTYLLNGQPFGGPGVSRFTLEDNLNLVLDTTLAWFMPRDLVANRLLLVVIGIVLGVLVGIALKANQTKLDRVWLKLGPLLLYTIGYLVFLVISSTTRNLDPIDDRLMSPVYVPIMLLSFVLLEAVGGAFANTGLAAKAVPIAVVLLIFAWLIYPIQRTRAEAMNYIRLGGYGFGTRGWRSSDTIKYFAANLETARACPTYTNGADVLYLLAKLEAKYLPDTSRLALITDQAAKGEWPRERKICYIWFKNVNRPYFISPQDLEAFVNIELVTQFEDGAYYTVSVKE